MTAEPSVQLSSCLCPHIRIWFVVSNNPDIRSVIVPKWSHPLKKSEKGFAHYFHYFYLWTLWVWLLPIFLSERPLFLDALYILGSLTLHCDINCTDFQVFCLLFICSCILTKCVLKTWSNLTIFSHVVSGCWVIFKFFSIFNLWKNLSMPFLLMFVYFHDSHFYTAKQCYKFSF